MLHRVGVNELKQINQLIDAGLTDKEIAYAFHISERTVYKIRRNKYDISHWDKEEE